MPVMCSGDVRGRGEADAQSEARSRAGISAHRREAAKAG